jgi:hypothetical protein
VLGTAWNLECEQYVARNKGNGETLRCPSRRFFVLWSALQSYQDVIAYE